MFPNGLLEMLCNLKKKVKEIHRASKVNYIKKNAESFYTNVLIVFIPRVFTQMSNSISLFLLLGHGCLIFLTDT